MKKVFLLTLLSAALTVNAFAKNDLDSLKQTLQVTTNDTLKADLYLKMAREYLTLNSPNHVYRERNGENSVNCTMLALRLYSRMEDSVGIRNSYTSLARAYRYQKQYTQAKWFMVQSSVLAKNQKDMPAMVAALVELANIKVENGDYILAKKDLSYALRVTAKYHVPDYQMTIINTIADVDKGIKDLPDDQQLKDAKELSAGYSTIIIDDDAPAALPAKAGAAKGKTKGKVNKSLAAKKPVKILSTDKLASL